MATGSAKCLAIATVRKIETGAALESGYFTVVALVTALGSPPEDLRA